MRCFFSFSLSLHSVRRKCRPPFRSTRHSKMLTTRRQSTKLSAHSSSLWCNSRGTSTGAMTMSSCHWPPRRRSGLTVRKKSWKFRANSHCACCGRYKVWPVCGVNILTMMMIRERECMKKASIFRVFVSSSSSCMWRAVEVQKHSKLRIKTKKTLPCYLSGSHTLLTRKSEGKFLTNPMAFLPNFVPISHNIHIIDAIEWKTIDEIPQKNENILQFVCAVKFLCKIEKITILQCLRSVLDSAVADCVRSN